MKIKFNNGREYDVLAVSYESDEMGIPVDIIITGSKEVLLSITDEQCLLGFNIQQDSLSSDASIHKALYGRLREFTWTK